MFAQSRNSYGNRGQAFPDFGGNRIHPSAGVVAVGARQPLIAFNINLDTSDVSIAKKIAKTTGRDLLEMDMILEKRLGTSIRTCFETKGEAYFRKKESDLAEEINPVGAVVSCGGGVVKNERNMKMLARNGRIYWIDRRPENLFASDDRPLSSKRSDLEALYEERKDLYARYCDVRIDNNGSLQDAVKAILADLGEGA